MRYQAQEYLTAHARKSGELWRFALGLVLVAVCYLALGYTYFTLIAELVTPQDWPALVSEIDNGSSSRGMLAVLASFGFIIIALAFVTNVLHGRTLATLFGYGRPFTMQFLRVATALGGLAAILWFLPEPKILKPFHNIDYLRWLALLPLSLPLLLVQVTSEELLFRGYIQSQLAARFNSPLIWLVLPSLVFGALHYDPASAGQNAWALAFSAALFGLVAADLTARSGTLAAAIALHLFFNLDSILYVAPGDRLHGLALYTYPFELSDPALLPVWLPYDIMILFCAWLAARLSMRR